MSDVESQVLKVLNEIMSSHGFHFVSKKHDYVFLISDLCGKDDVTMCSWTSVKEMFIDGKLFDSFEFMKQNIEELDSISGHENFSRFLTICDQHSLESLNSCSCLEEVLLKLSCLC